MLKFINETTAMITDGERQMMILGAHLVPVKFLMDVSWYLKADMFGKDWGLQVLKFDASGHPRNEDGVWVFGATEPDSLTAIINMQRLIDFSVEKAQEGHPGRVDDIFWHALWDTFAHEQVHGIAITVIRETGDESLEDVSCKEAEDLAKEILIELCKVLDMEMPQPGTWGEYMERKLDTVPDAVKVRREEMIKDDVIYRDLSNARPIEFTKFRDVIQAASDSPEDPAWAKEVIKADCEYEAPQEVVEAIEKIDATHAETPTTEAMPEKATPPNLWDAPQAEFDPNGVVDENTMPYAENVTAGMPTTVPGAYQYMTTSPNFNTAPKTALETAQAAFGTKLPKKDTFDRFVVAPEPCPESGLAPDQQLAAFHQSLLCMYHHLRTKCGWDPQSYELGFSNPWNVVDPCDLRHIPNSNKIVLAHDMLDAQKQILQKQMIWERPAGLEGYTGGITGMVVGKTASGTPGLPMYKLYINKNGMMSQRTFMPQNPTKDTVNGRRARAGELIMYLYDNTKPRTDGPNIILSIEPNKQTGHVQVRVWE